MNVKRLLVKLADAFAELDMKPIMIGNAAGAVRGVPIKANDIDFIVSEIDYSKLTALAEKLNGKLKSDESSTRLFVHFVQTVYIDFHIKTSRLYMDFEENATPVHFSDNPILVAGLEDVLADKLARNLHIDQWAEFIYTNTMLSMKGELNLTGIDYSEQRMIELNLTVPMNERTRFLNERYNLEEAGTCLNLTLAD